MNESIARLWEHWITQDLLVIGGFVLVFWLLRCGSKNERWQRAWQRMRRDRMGLIALGIVCLYLFVGALDMLRIPPLWNLVSKETISRPYEHGTGSILDLIFCHVASEKTYSEPMSDEVFNSPRHEKLNGRHLLGTDVLGKDVLVQTLKACRTALVIGGLTSAIYVPLGALLGVLAGYFRRRVDDVVQYVYSTLASIPEVLLLVAILMVLGKGLGTMSIALGVTGWVTLCRLVRGETMRQSERPYVAAARALGQSHWKIVTRHLLPNVMHLVLISFVLGFSGIVLAEAVLSYLGVGAPVGTASWGAMIDSGRSELARDPVVWWNVSAAASALFILVLSLNLLGDSLRRAFDPKRT